MPYYILYAIILFGNVIGMENGRIDTNLISGKEIKVLIMKVSNEGSVYIFYE